MKRTGGRSINIKGPDIPGTGKLPTGLCAQASGPGGLIQLTAAIREKCSDALKISANGQNAELSGSMIRVASDSTIQGAMKLLLSTLVRQLWTSTRSLLMRTEYVFHLSKCLRGLAKQL